ncbi:MAG TPA: alpha/beta fold hydrolase [Thermoplasmata archaeon]|jgi:pimeloyl-ACP methyl ester carboxylesterase|nr:alpha/beta fold hydrolase [Thermoplasmata archaeon]
MPEELAAPPMELSCRVEGTGPAVVLLHGVGGNHTVWNDVIPGLSKEFLVLAPDLRGHGRSRSPAGSHYTFAELAGDVLHLLDEKGLPSAHVVGLSGGALLALRITLDHPERVRSLTMVSGAAYADAHTRSVAQRWGETLAEEGRDRFALRLLKDLYYPDWVEANLDFADAVREQVRHQDYAPAIAWAVSMGTFDERNRVASVARPTLIVQGMNDAVVDASHGRILRQSIPGAQLRILTETGHLVPVERPKELVETMLVFLRSADRTNDGGRTPRESPSGP